MKKLRLSNIFHWLYAFLMFLPILSYLGQYLVLFGAGNYSDVVPFESLVSDVVGTGFASDGLGGSIFHAFDYVLSDVFGMSQFTDGFTSLFTYWVCISLAYLLFDLVMFMVNLAHRWIDKGGLE